MALEIKPTKSYKTDLKKYKNNEKVCNRLKTAIDLLIKGNPLPTDYRDHIYVGGYRKYKNVRDCHILPDCVLLYTKTSDSLILIRLGNHGSIVESLKKLRIKEDTACVASKTSYMDEDGLDKNGIYYFGDKPNLPVNWKDAFKKKKNKQIKEGVNGNMIKQYIEVDSKQVKDSGGWLTDYTMYMRIETTRDNWLAFLQSEDVQHGNIDIPEDWITGYVFVFGDSDIYGPEDEDFDWECDTEEEAYEWFNNYNGFDDEDEFDWDLDESLNESVIDDSGMFMQMDDAMSGLIENVSDSDIDEVVRYYSTISGKLGKKDKFSDIVCYFCSDYADVCDPIDSSKIYFGFKSVYKDRKFDSYVSSKYGDKFVIDHFNDNFMFTVYATNEDVINRLIDDLSNEYDNL